MIFGRASMCCNSVIMRSSKCFQKAIEIPFKGPVTECASCYETLGGRSRGAQKGTPEAEMKLGDGLLNKIINVALGDWEEGWKLCWVGSAAHGGEGWGWRAERGTGSSGWSWPGNSTAPLKHTDTAKYKKGQESSPTTARYAIRSQFHYQGGLLIKADVSLCQVRGQLLSV